MLSEEEFAEQSIVYLKSIIPDAAVVRANGLELTLEIKGQEFNASLHNIYTDYSKYHHSLDRVFERHASIILDRSESSDEEKPVNFDNVVPIIKSRGYVENASNWLQASGADTFKTKVYNETINVELVILYAEVTDGNFRFLMKEEIESEFSNKEDLRKKALSNLRRILPEIERRGEERVFVLTAGVRSTQALSCRTSSGPPRLFRCGAIS